jgi:hypothetical protein
MLLWLIIGGAVVLGSFLLALVSEEFAYALSRVVEAVFDALEYKAALRQARTQRSRQSVERMTYAASYPRAI